MLGRIPLRMTPPAFVLVLSLTFPVDIQAAAEPDHKRSSEIVIPPSANEAGSEMNWLDRLPISKVCKKELLLGTVFGALGGAVFFGRRKGSRGILVGAPVGAATGAAVITVVRCVIFDILWPDLFPISAGCKDGLLSGIMGGSLVGAILKVSFSSRWPILSAAVVYTFSVGIVWHCLVRGILLPYLFPNVFD
ncbi:hypothetical protein [Pasteuria penetrans]|uniref:hypothetical protein n=1 Tax=Pasteuria penetrans TaxID=86005 RepID=UPI000FC01898|nr:hypothetical protein [Pasteuria penetrans]